MFKSIGCAAVLTLLAGCASWLDDRPAREARQQPAAQGLVVDAEMRSRLEVLRRQPELASDELIRDLEAFLRERERARLARVTLGAANVAALPAPAAAAVAPVASVTPLPQAGAVARAKPPMPERPAAAPAAATAEAAVRPVPVPAAPAVAARSPAPVRVMADPAPPAFVAAPGTPSLAEAQALFARARTLEDERQVGRAVPLYTDASRQGLVAASVRLMELYASGAEGLARNYLAAVRFKDLALQQGAKLDIQHRR